MRKRKGLKSREVWREGIQGGKVVVGRWLILLRKLLGYLNIV
jgi:hypothetical protein